MAHRTQEEAELILNDARSRVTVGGIYVHYKHPDRTYKVLHIGFVEATDEPCVIYESEYGNKHIYVRPLENFLETIEVGGARVPRFKKL